MTRGLSHYYAPETAPGELFAEHRYAEGRTTTGAITAASLLGGFMQILRLVAGKHGIKLAGCQRPFTPGARVEKLHF
jgi:hypothetical protein